MFDIIQVFEDMLETGQPPIDGCKKLGVGYEEAFSRLERTYFLGTFERGKSTEKFVVGPYGSGKTHFLRQLLETARENNCATAEVPLSKNIDITKILLVYKEIAREITVPNQQVKGVRHLIKTAITDFIDRLPDPAQTEKHFESWLNGFDEMQFEDSRYRRVLKKTLFAVFSNDAETSEAGFDWLEGEISDRNVCKKVGISPIRAAEQSIFGSKAILTLGQFVRQAGYRGTAIAFDEAEQAASVSLRQRDKILSMTRSELDAVKKVEEASLFILYAFTPDVVQEMMNYDALSSRIREPDQSHRFFDGNDYTPIIDLEQPYADPDESLDVLKKIGKRLVNLLHEAHPEVFEVADIEEVLRTVDGWAESVHNEDASIQNRRIMVKQTCSRLMRFYKSGVLDSGTPVQPKDIDDEPEV